MRNVAPCEHFRLINGILDLFIALYEDLSLVTLKLCRPIDYMYALTQLDCTEPMSNGGSPSHLLRCSYQLYTHNEVCGRPIILKCSK